MDEKMHSVSCDPKCGFMVKSHDKEEVKMMAKGHAKNKHNDDVSDEQMEGMVKSE